MIRQSWQLGQLVLLVEVPHYLVNLQEALHEFFAHLVEFVLVVLFAGDDLNELFSVGRGFDGQLGTVPDHKIVAITESVVVSFAEDIGHAGFAVLHAQEGGSDEGQQPHHSEEVSAGRVVGLVLFGSLEFLVVAGVVHHDVELHLHLHETEEALVTLESLVVFCHNSDLVLDVREGYPQEGVDLFESLAELVQDHEEVLKNDIFDLVVSLDHFLSVHDRQVNVEVFILLFVGLHWCWCLQIIL